MYNMYIHTLNLHLLLMEFLLGGGSTLGISRIGNAPFTGLNIRIPNQGEGLINQGATLCRQ